MNFKRGQNPHKIFNIGKYTFSAGDEIEITEPLYYFSKTEAKYYALPEFGYLTEDKIDNLLKLPRFIKGDRLHFETMTGTFGFDVFVGNIKSGYLIKLDYLLKNTHVFKRI